MNSMRAANRRRVLELKCAPFEHGLQRDESLTNQMRGLLHLQCLRGVDDVVRSEPIMQPTRLLSEPLGVQAFCNGCRKGDDVVFDLSLDLLDARD